MRIYTENFIPGATITVTSGTAHASYPVGNLNSLIVAKQLRISAAHAGHYLILKIDFGAAKTCNYIGFGGKKEDGSIVLKVDTGDGGASFDTTLINGASMGNEKDNMIATMTSTKRYWELTISGFTVNTDYLSILYMGTSYETPHNEEPKINLTDNFRGSHINTVFHRGQIRTKQADSRRGQSGITLANMTETQKDAFYAEFNGADTMNGISQPFFIEEDDGTISYVTFDPKRYDVIKNIEDSYDITFGVIEQL